MVLRVSKSLGLCSFQLKKHGRNGFAGFEKIGFMFCASWVLGREGLEVKTCLGSRIRGLQEPHAPNPSHPKPQTLNTKKAEKRRLTRSPKPETLNP